MKAKGKPSIIISGTYFNFREWREDSTGKITHFDGCGRGCDNTVGPYKTWSQRAVRVDEDPLKFYKNFFASLCFTQAGRTLTDVSIIPDNDLGFTTGPGNKNSPATSSCKQMLSGSPYLLTDGELYFGKNQFTEYFSKYNQTNGTTSQMIGFTTKNDLLKLFSIASSNRNIDADSYEATGTRGGITGAFGIEGVRGPLNPGSVIGGQGLHFFAENPRVAVGFSDEAIFFVKVEGRGGPRRSHKNQGGRGACVDVIQLAYIMKGLGCSDVINLDGGVTAQMMYKTTNQVSDGLINSSPFHKIINPP